MASIGQKVGRFLLGHQCSVFQSPAFSTRSIFYTIFFKVSKTKNLEVNSLAIPRKPGEAVGAICNLKHKDGRSLTINVEYN